MRKVYYTEAAPGSRQPVTKGLADLTWKFSPQEMPETRFLFFEAAAFPADHSSS
jgi:hypothetical protein